MKSSRSGFLPPPPLLTCLASAVEEILIPFSAEERAAERLKRQEMIGKHWSEKELEEMNDRDWRIFREVLRFASWHFLTDAGLPHSSQRGCGPKANPKLEGELPAGIGFGWCPSGCVRLIDNIKSSAKSGTRSRRRFKCSACRLGSSTAT
jgi:hypothetical protein